MANYLEIQVVRGDGRIAPIPFDGDDLLVACRLGIKTAQTLVVDGCPFGDQIPPRCVNIIKDGKLMFSIAIHPVLKP